jgi:acyl transferase domain-containing protein
VPLQRWDIERMYTPGLASDKMYARHAAWLDSVDRFDAALFGFSKAQATATDPQVLCICTGKCCSQQASNQPAWYVYRP